MVFAPQTLTLDAFLQLPDIDASPAWEYGDGKMRQKPMPKIRHSLLQKQLLSAINSDYAALPKLRCTFGGRSIVPDVAIVLWNRIPVDESGEPQDDFKAAPDWAVEILSPGQPSTRVIDNILHALQHGCSLGWLVDPDDYAVIVFRPGQEPVLYRNDQPLPTLGNVALTAAQIFGWLKIRRS